MTEENTAQVAEQETTTQAAEEAASSIQEQENGQTEAAQGGEQEQARDFEAEAHKHGWVPKDKFKGDPEKWVDAQEFVERGETFIPFIQADRRKLQERLDQIEAERKQEKADFAKRLERMEKMGEAATKRQKEAYQAELTRLRAEMRKAVEDGDTAAFDKLETQREALSKQTFDEPGEAETSDDPQAVQAAWAAKNPWFDEDIEMATKATIYSQRLAKNNPKITLQDNLSQTEAYIKEQYPEKFGGTKKPAANGHAAVDSGGDFPGGNNSRRGKGYGDLPAEAKAACDRFVEQKIMTKEQYVKDYFND